MKKLLLILLIATFTCMTLSCNQTAEETSPPADADVAEVYTQYTVEELELRGEAAGFAFWSGTDIRLSGMSFHAMQNDRVVLTASDTEKRVYAVSFAFDGTDCEADSYDSLIAGLSADALGMEQMAVVAVHRKTDGLYVLLLQDSAAKTVRLVSLDTAGQPTAVSDAVPYEILSTEDGYYSRVGILAADDDCLILMDVGQPTVCRMFDASLTAHGPFETASPVYDAFRAADGSVILCLEDTTTVRYDPTTEQLTPCRLYEETDARRAAAQIFYAPDAVYLIGADGVTLQRDGTETVLFSWADSALDRDALVFLDVLSDDRFLVSYTDPLTGREYPAILLARAVSVTEDGEAAETTEVCAASWNCTDAEKTVFRAAVNLFNQNQQQYRINLVEYDTMFDDGRYNRETERVAAVRAQLETDLLNGVAYDVLFIGSANNLDNYTLTDTLAEKQLLYDLSVFAEKIDMLACVRDMLNENAAVTELPLTAQISTLLVSEDTLPRDTLFTFQALTDILQSLQDGQTLFGNDETEELYAVTQSDFVSKESGTCSFDSGEYLAFLAFMDEMEDGLSARTATRCCDPYIGKITGNAFGMTQMDSDDFLPITARYDPIGAFNDGRLKFVTCEIANLNTLQTLFYLLEQLDSSAYLCGYPSRTGGSLYAEAGATVSVMKYGENTAGALEFLRVLYSDEIQLSETLADSGVPVTRTAVEAAIPAGEYGYSLKEMTRTVYLTDPPSEIHDYTYECEEIAADGTLSAAYDAVCAVSKEERDSVMAQLVEAAMKSEGDPIISDIIEEELSAVENGVRSPEEAVKIIQSRVFIYINE
ncbi:MAG: extracellular solute-binding protein [Clostridia bacterium]|nr:extracellular solute-binding protein [Clostridia bacterium]